MIRIMRQTNAGRVEVFRTPLNEGCRMTGKLMDSFMINIKFSTLENVVFKIGDYIDLASAEYDGTFVEADGNVIDYAFPSYTRMKYVLRDVPLPVEDATTGGYDYDLKFVSFFEAWSNKIYKFVPSIYGQEAKWSYTGTLREHLAIFLLNIKAYAAESHIYRDFLDDSKRRIWKEDINPLSHTDDELNAFNMFYVEDGKIDESGVLSSDGGATTPLYINDRHVFLSFENTNVGSVFSTLCSQENFDCDYWYEDGLFHFGKCERGTMVNLNSEGEEPDCLIASSGASGEFSNRLICFGGDKNLTARYRKSLIFTADDVIAPPQVGGTLGYNADDYAFFMRDSSKVNLTARIIKKKNRLTTSTNKPIQITDDDGRITFKGFKTYSTGIYTLTGRDQYFKPPFGELDHTDYRCDFEIDGNPDSEFVRLGELNIPIGVVGTKALHINPSIDFSAEAWFANNKELIDKDDKHSRQSNLLAYFILYEVVFEGNVVGTKVSFATIDRFTHEWVISEGESVTDVPLGFAFNNDTRPESNPKFASVIVDVNNDYGDYTLRVTFGVHYQQGSAAGYHFLRSKVSGAFDVSLGVSALRGFCNIITDDDFVNGGLVFNPLCFDDGNKMYSYFGVKTYAAGRLGLTIDNVKGLKYELGDIVFGQVPVSYFSDGTSGDIIVNSVINRNLMLPEKYYLYYHKTTDARGVTEYDKIEYSLDEKTGTGWRECHDNYIDIYEDLHPSELKESVNVNADIYPMMLDKDGNPVKVLQVGLHEMVKDDDTDYEVGKTHYRYVFNTTFPFSEDCVIAGQTLRVKFTSGDLNGMEFDAEFYTYLEGNIPCADGTYMFNDVTRGDCFAINPNEDYGVELPNEIVKPKEDDTFILLGFDPTAMDDDFGIVGTAEERLLRDEVNRANQMRNNTATYTATLSPQYAYDNRDLLYIGRKVKVFDAATMTRRESRVIGYDMCMDYPYDNPKFTIGQSAEYSRLRKMESQTSAKSDGTLA